MIIKINDLDESGNDIINKAVDVSKSFNHKHFGSEHLLFLALETNHPIGVELSKLGLTLEKLSDFIDEHNNGRVPEMSDKIKGMTKEFELLISDVIFNSGVPNPGSFELIIGIQMNQCAAMDIIEDFLNSIGLKAIKKSMENNKSALEKYGTDLTELAKTGELDLVIGREKELQEIIHVLLRKNKSNPCLVGESGVGKTAVVDLLAQKIVKNEVPPKLKDKRIISLNISEMLSGAKFRGEFEERLNSVLKEVKKEKNIILFFDEIHTIFGAGAGNSGELDASNILKPSLARGNFQMIGATTVKEYKRTVQEDAAFERRMEQVRVNESSVEESIEILSGLKKSYEKFHGVKIEDKAIEAAVNLSNRYINDKFLPDKAITIIDEISAKNSILKNKIVSVKDIKKIITDKTGVKIDEDDKNSLKALINLESSIKERLIGQDKAVSLVSKAIKRSRSGLKNPNRPIGSFLFVGPTGVGKTELAKIVSEKLTGNSNSLIKVDMSEYMEKHSVAKLIGSPPGYVGHDDGGQLTDKVRRNPYSVVLFDEIEKAHPEVSDLLLQILDEGELTDSKGVKVDFKNTLIILTSNIGSNLVASKKKSIGFGSNSENQVIEENSEIITNAVKERFRPEFINRLDDIVIFNPLNEESCYEIAKVMIGDLSKRIQNIDVKVNFTKSIIDTIVEKGFDEKMGARNLKRTIQTMIEDELSDAIIEGLIEGGNLVTVSFRKGNISIVKKEESYI